MVQEVPQSQLGQVQQLKLDPGFSNAHAQVILELMEQVLEISPEEPFETIGAAFASNDYGYFRLAFRKDQGDSEQENALWVEYVRVRHDPEFKPQLIRVMEQVGVLLPA
ncbi:hypothetical protein H6G89_12865 [Oscillatoria sp. FACHB-1407]|uniref:hypothetical protein n=1 Tax=Oscillatoria sp. FACHB-1407 TaxID=2692847 RepID=UPI0016847384|nr:hypothetical protein [Oscillatoria sp. FACHB-1407]MBD2461938.1 hypothetical protein [Oscillatoria sp. FACHB-1407]